MNIQVTIEGESRVVSAQLVKVISALDELRRYEGVKSLNISAILENISTLVPNRLGFCDVECPSSIETLIED